jgi:hypothetical protein
MPTRQDAVNTSIEASAMQKDLVKDTRRGLFPILTDSREIVKAIREKGVKIKITKFWPLTIEVKINN